MENRIWILLQLLFVAVMASAQTQSVGNSSCPLQDETSQLDASKSGELNQALLSAYNSFNQNPTYSLANAVFSSAMDSFPSSVSASLSCSGYDGINLNSLPAWLTAVPTSYISEILQEQSAYSSIISSFVAEASTGTASSVDVSLPSSAIATQSSPTTPGSTPSIMSATSIQPPSPTPSTGGVARTVTTNLRGILLLAASALLFLL
ncbi:hypothetical protein TMatcc_009345 [Talaromyces marneffei ATCC 18224]|uniref:uncharacterized protein n=1 Tax=Talaromyces marneffei TaxID=37727 RepID=UPI0012AA08D8|nr:uncharacterized protein EYB26_008603 [Talaromyces marneffei]KAE8551233.1 hypothetical protein EYB25_007469 [Talaromyces marneffei]QGA20893.1 hypothetical protein EYB26_008603 [Talaromyces marneffei]